MMQEPVYPHKSLCNGLLYGALGLVIVGQLFFRTMDVRVVLTCVAIGIAIGVAIYKCVYAHRQGMTDYIRKTMLLVGMVSLMVLLFVIAMNRDYSETTSLSVNPMVCIVLSLTAIVLFMITFIWRAITGIKIKRGDTSAAKNYKAIRTIALIAVGLIIIDLILMII